MFELERPNPGYRTQSLTSRSERKANRKMKQGAIVASSMPRSVRDGVFLESGSKRSLPAESEAGKNRSKRRRNDDNFLGELCDQGFPYAIDQLSYSQNLRHVFNFLVIDGKLWICYYDHTGIIRNSQPLDSVNDLPRYVLLLKCTKDISKGECGGSDQVTKSKDHNAVPGSVPGDDTRANASSSIDKHCVKNANVKDATHEGPDIMTQFSPSIRGQVFCFIGRLAETRSHGSLGRVFGDFMTRPNTKEVTCKLHVSEDLDDLMEAKICFRQRLNVLKFLDGVENRVLRAIAFELLIPIYKLVSPEKFKKCFRGIFQGHHFLWFKGVKHRDISVGNLMCRCVGDEVYGVLNDWDLSKLEGSKEPTSISRTGTRPFMAMDLLDELQDHSKPQDSKPQGHLERYDWESMLYVLIWIACRYDANGKEVNENALREWFKHDLKALADNKGSIILKGKIPSLNEHYRGLRNWITGIRKLFYAGYGYKGEYSEALVTVAEGSSTQFDLSKPYVDETLGGHVTYKKLLEIYKS
ncbi:hypothetical protein M0805_006011 [Coniferiporia weirii]|nr:hypothetical protein M0805_006011 [Coniferiporia weirii]